LETIIATNTLPEQLATALRSDKTRVFQANDEIRLVPYINPPKWKIVGMLKNDPVDIEKFIAEKQHEMD
jgi:hypothetical protein